MNGIFSVYIYNCTVHQTLLVPLFMWKRGVRLLSLVGLLIMSSTSPSSASPTPCSSSSLALCSSVRASSIRTWRKMINMFLMSAR